MPSKRSIEEQEQRFKKVMTERNLARDQRDYFMAVTKKLLSKHPDTWTKVKRGAPTEPRR